DVGCGVVLVAFVPLPAVSPGAVGGLAVGIVALVVEQPADALVQAAAVFGLAGQFVGLGGFQQAQADVPFGEHLVGARVGAGANAAPAAGVPQFDHVPDQGVVVQAVVAGQSQRKQDGLDVDVFDVAGIHRGE